MLGQMIAKLRKEKGLTQARFADAIHVTQGAVSQWETGRTCPDIQQMFILADFFGVTVEELKSGEKASQGAVAQQNEPVEQSRDLYTELLTNFAALPDPQTKEEVLAYLRFRLGESKKT